MFFDVALLFEVKHCCLSKEMSKDGSEERRNNVIFTCNERTS
jgi:hypothetical protein